MRRPSFGFALNEVAGCVVLIEGVDGLRKSFASISLRLLSSTLKLLLAARFVLLASFNTPTIAFALCFCTPPVADCVSDPVSLLLPSLRAPTSTGDRINAAPKINSTNQSVRCREMKRYEQSLVAPNTHVVGIV